MTDHSERPILMDALSITSILDGSKTQTRRLVKPQPPPNSPWDAGSRLFVLNGSQLGVIRRCPFGNPATGETHLWVRETFAVLNDDEWGWTEYANENRGDYLEYRADSGNPYPGDWPADEARGNPDAPKWRPSIHMPRTACRITLRVKRVWAHQIHKTDLEDIIAEGCPVREKLAIGFLGDSPSMIEGWFMGRWDTIYASRGFGFYDHAWVWACEFERVT